MSGSRHNNPARHIALPAGAYLIALVLFAIAVPSALRPPPDPASTSAEFSPDAPPDDDQDQIIAALSRAQTGTAGTGEGTGDGNSALGGPEALPEPPPPPRGCPGGYGSPPRQVESLYSAPCAPAWAGDNGGATWKNVTANEIRFGVSHVLGNASEGLIKDQPPANEGDAHRTLRVLQAYFNANFQFYGRRLQLVQLPASTANAVDNSAHAAKAAEEYRVFGSYYLYSGYCEQMARRQLVMFCNPMPEAFHEKWAPYVWAWMMDYSKVDRMGAEYICKKLEGKQAAFAGPGVEGQPRKFGLLFEVGDARNAGRGSGYLIGQLQEQCGIERDQLVAIDIDSSRESANADFASAVSRFRAAGVTSVVLQTEFVPAVQIMNASDGQGWYPEWLLFFPYGLDINTLGSLMPQAQMTHAFGLSAWEMPARNAEVECYRAYKSIDPNTEPNMTTCFNFFPQILQFANGVQAAGPKLTPLTFRDALFKIGHRFYPQPWAVGGGFGPGDWTYMDNMAEIWWDPTAPKPENGSPGAYSWVRNGQRYREGELPVEDPLVFSDGTASRPTSG